MKEAIEKAEKIGYYNGLDKARDQIKKVRKHLEELCENSPMTLTVMNEALSHADKEIQKIMEKKND